MNKKVKNESKAFNPQKITVLYCGEQSRPPNTEDGTATGKAAIRQDLLQVQASRVSSVIIMERWLSGPPSGQSAGGGTRIRNRMVPADFRADSLATVPPAPPYIIMTQH
ncbi:hypothetical protein PoB_006082800 [Plakobranchus ocellatus]|uniref:Uncharacterized protein n=1 Tax=Plakobranchus ocellatus TaxID=259542 RepID=A0AAV4CR29_9GAST|nr:hypothetical protein PoB_006082800 [Plakobranchus ocellatus]